MLTVSLEVNEPPLTSINTETRHALRASGNDLICPVYEITALLFCL